MSRMLADGGSRGLLRKTFGELGLLSLSAFLFAFSFPSFISVDGLWPLVLLHLSRLSLLFIVVLGLRPPSTALFTVFFHMLF